MRSVITITELARRRGAYEISVLRGDGRVIGRLTAGDDPGSAAGYATQLALEHCIPNSAGGDVVGPERVTALIPKHIRSIPPQSLRDKDIYGKT